LLHTRTSKDAHGRPARAENDDQALAGRDQSHQRDLLESVEQLAGMGSWEWFPDSEELIWSDNCFRVLGLEPVAAEPSPELVIELTHPDDREMVRERIEAIRKGVGVGPFDYRIVTADHEVRHIRAVITSEEREPRYVLGHALDITDRLRDERQIQAHTAVAEALGHWDTLERSGENLVAALGEALQFSVGAMWVPQGDLLTLRVFWQAGPGDGGEAEQIFLDRRLRLRLGLPGRVWASGKPAGLVSVFEDPSFDRRQHSTLAGLRSAIAFPARMQTEVLAVIEFLSPEEFTATERLMASFAGIGRELGHFLNRRRGELLPAALTPREIEVLQLAAYGSTAPQIAEALVVSRNTVKTHLGNIYSKLEVNDRAAAVAQAMRLGLID
jgi:DNA-binding CsgD family transcriptional regulator